MFKKIRITILSICLFYVATGAYLDTNHNWDKETVVVVHPINATEDKHTQALIDGFKEKDFDVIERFIKENSLKYRGSEVDFRVVLGEQVFNHPPQPSEEIANSIPRVILWSLKFRFFGVWNKKKEDFGSATVLYMNLYNPSMLKGELNRSTALERGRLAVVNLYAEEEYIEMNKGVVLHELLHTFGTEDRYDMFDGNPYFPEGYAEPTKTPLYPQIKAEIMGGYIPISDRDFLVVKHVDDFVMNDVTAKELGWLKATP